jgi:hypothetical protein
MGTVSCKRETYLEVANINENKPELLTGKWMVSYVNQGFTQTIGDQVLFNSDGTLTVMRPNSNQTGTWKIADNTLTSDRIYNSNTANSSAVTSYTIEKLTNNELILATSKTNVIYRIKFIK